MSLPSFASYLLYPMKEEKNVLQKGKSMAEKIYSIKIKEAFSAKKGCPICALRELLSQDEIDRILGAAMMEPDIRKETNRKGFCKNHLQGLFAAGNKLPLALMLSTHLQEAEAKLFKKTTGAFAKTPDPKKLKDAYESARKSCYLCGRINEFMGKVLDNLCYLYQTDSTFPPLFKEQEYFCQTHSYRLLEAAEKYLPKKERAAFSGDLALINQRYIQKLQEDLDWFAKKFDYRYEKEDWKDAKDAPERATRYLY